jgi:hypothetical protein
VLICKHSGGGNAVGDLHEWLNPPTRISPMNKADDTTASQLDPRPLTSDDLAAAAGGVVICYGVPQRPHPGPHDGAPFVPPGHPIP